MSSKTFFPLIMLAACGQPSAQAPDIITLPQLVEPTLVKVHNLHGDIWANNGDVYSFGDGTGMSGCLPSLDGEVPGEALPWSHTFENNCYRLNLSVPTADIGRDQFCEANDCSICFTQLCPYTAAGMVVVSDMMGPLTECVGGDQCVVARHLPQNDRPYFDVRRVDNKPTSLVRRADRLIASMHSPAGSVDFGFLAYTDNMGQSWESPGSTPWRGPTPFKVMMFAQPPEQTDDAFVYALAIEHELTYPTSQQVYLARSRLGTLEDYTSFEYRTLSGWSPVQTDASAIPGLHAVAKGSLVYHKGLGCYLFLSGMAQVGDATSKESWISMIYAAKQPDKQWLPAYMWTGHGYIASLLSEQADSSVIQFIASGGSLPYKPHVFQIDASSIARLTSGVCAPQS